MAQRRGTTRAEDAQGTPTQSHISPRILVNEEKSVRAFAVKVDTKRLPVFLFSGVDLYHDFRNDAFCDLHNLLKVRKIGNREVVVCQPLPQSLYTQISRTVLAFFYEPLSSEYGSDGHILAWALSFKP